MSIQARRDHRSYFNYTTGRAPAAIGGAPYFWPGFYVYNRLSQEKGQNRRKNSKNAIAIF